MGITIVIPTNGTNSPSLANDAAENRTFDFTDTPGALCSVFGSNNGINYSTSALITLGANTGPKTIADRSLFYKATVANGSASSLSVRVGKDTSGSNPGHLDTLVLGDFPAGGVVGTAPNTVDQFGAISIAQTTPGQTLTAPNPTDGSPTDVIWINNIGSASFVLYGLIVLAGASTKIVWNGSAWVEGCTGTATPTSTMVSGGGKQGIGFDGVNMAIGSLDPAAMTGIVAGSGGGQFAVSGGSLDLEGDATFVVANGGLLSLIGANGIGISTRGLAGIEFTPGVGGGALGLAPWGVAPGNTTRILWRTLAASNKFVSFQAPDAMGANTAYVLPSAFPTINNQWLTSTVTGGMTWRGAIDVGAGNSNAQSIADGAAPAVITTWTEVTDTASAFNAATGVFVPPVAGFYWIAVQIEFAASVSILNGEFSVQIFKNGAPVAIGATQSEVALGAARHQAATQIGVQLGVSDSIDFRAAQNGGAGAVVLTNSTTRNLVSISLGS